MKKRAISVFLVTVLILGALAGCGGSGSGSKRVNKSKLIGNTYVEDFPIVKETETLKIMVVKLPNHSDLDTMGFTTEYEDLTNVKVDWNVVTPNDIDSQKTLALTSGNLPDVMCLLDNRLGDNDLLTYSKNGTFIQLDELIETYGSNIKKMFEKYPDVEANSKSIDGKIFSLPTVNKSSENHMRFPYKLYIRQKWLDNLGLETPTTVNQFYDVLKAFKKDDPNGNGDADEIPFAMPGINPSYFGSWGVSYHFTTRNLSVDENGQVQYSYATDGTKKGLSFLNRIVSEELGVMFDTDNKFNTRVKNGMVGAFYGIDKYNVAGEIGDEYEMIAPLNAEDGSQPTLSVSNDTIPNIFVITKACKNPATALRWVDYFYSAEGSLLANYGKEGDLIEKAKNGKYEFITGKNALDRYQYTLGHALPMLIDDDINGLILTGEDSKSDINIMRERELIDDTKNTYFGKYEPKNEIGLIFPDEQANAVIDKYWTGITDYANEKINQFALGEENVDTGWSAYIAELEKKGYKEVMAEFQRIYDQQRK